VTNAAKHAQARSVEVDVSVVASELTVTVLDDGVGLGDVQRSSGLANLSARAEGYGGSCAVSNRASGGTQLIWKATIQ